jgi:hypothetical protein
MISETSRLCSCITVKYVVFCYMTPCGSNKKRRFGGTFPLNLQGKRTPVTLKMQAMCFSGTSVLTRATRDHIPEGSILMLLKQFLNERNDTRNISSEEMWC